MQTINGRNANWIGHILCRNCLLKHIIEKKIEGRIEVTERRGRWREQLLDDFKENRGYWELKEEAVARAGWRSGCERCCASVVRQVWKNLNLRYVSMTSKRWNL